MSLPIDDNSQHPFGQYTVQGNKVIYLTDLSVAFVNVAPVQPGHLLVIPQRVACHVTDMTPDELKDMWTVAAELAKVITSNYQSINPKAPVDTRPSFTYAIQDGVDAGQTVRHVHIHILPRIKGDFERNDDVYGLIEKNEKDIDRPTNNQSINQQSSKPKNAHMDTERVRLTDQEQIDLATRYREWMKTNQYHRSTVQSDFSDSIRSYQSINQSINRSIS